MAKLPRLNFPHDCYPSPPNRNDEIQAKRCHYCGGTIVFGEMHEVWIDGETTFWCIECSEYDAAASWNCEDWGPRHGINIVYASEAVN